MTQSRTPPSNPRPASRSQRGSSAQATSHQARRKRTVTRQMRRLEVAFSALPAQLKLDRARQVVSGVGGSGWHLSKLLSGLLLAGLFTALYWVHTEDTFFVYAEDVQFANLVHLQADELYATSDVDGWNIFWLQPNMVRQRLLQHPWLEDARVRLALPAAMSIRVQEMRPVALWVTNAGTYWLAASGAALPVEGEPDPNLPQIVDSLQEARSLTAGDTAAMDPQILASALALVEALPELEGKVRYNRTVGLNFPLPKPAIWVYWGDGYNMQEKLENLAATREVVRTSETPAQIVDIRFVDRPYFR